MKLQRIFLPEDKPSALRAGDIVTFQHGPDPANLFAFEVLEVDHRGRGSKARFIFDEEWDHWIKPVAEARTEGRFPLYIDGYPVEQTPPGEIVRVSECVVGQVYWTTAMGTVRDGGCFTKSRYEQDDSANRDRFCHLFVSLPDGDYKGGEKARYAADEEVIQPKT